MSLRYNGTYKIQLVHKTVDIYSWANNRLFHIRYIIILNIGGEKWYQWYYIFNTGVIAVVIVPPNNAHSPLGIKAAVSPPSSLASWKSSWNKDVETVPQQAHRYLEPVICPATKLHVTILVVKWEPGDVNGTGGHEDAGRNVGAQTFVSNHHVGRVGCIESFAGTKNIWYSWYNSLQLVQWSGARSGVMLGVKYWCYNPGGGEISKINVLMSCIWFRSRPH